MLVTDDAGEVVPVVQAEFVVGQREMLLVRVSEDKGRRDGAHGDRVVHWSSVYLSICLSVHLYARIEICSWPVGVRLGSGSKLGF